jgi:hypothetical protein
MSTLTFTIIGTGKKTTTVKANIEGQIVKFFGVDKATYLKRMKSYQAPSRRHWLLSWLNKNNSHTDPPMTPQTPVEAKKTLLPQSLRPVAKAAPKSTPVVALSLGAMVMEVERQLVAKGYTLVKKGTTIPMSICTQTFGKTIERGCGKKSMIGAYKELPELKFIGVCYNRYNIASACKVVKVWGKKDARAWLDKQKAA